MCVFVCEKEIEREGERKKRREEKIRSDYNELISIVEDLFSRLNSISPISTIHMGDIK